MAGESLLIDGSLGVSHARVAMFQTRPNARIVVRGEIAYIDELGITRRTGYERIYWPSDGAFRRLESDQFNEELEYED
jgi:hypothetical protein